MHDDLPRAAAQRGGDLLRQQRGRRPGDEHLRPFGIEQAAHEPLPSGDHLHLVQAPRHPHVAQVREPPVVLVHHHPQVAAVQTVQPFVLERQVRQALTGHAPVEQPAAHPVQKGGLARPADAGDRRRLAGERQPAEDSAGRVLRQRPPQRIGELFGQDPAAQHVHSVQVLLVERRIYPISLLPGRRITGPAMLPARQGGAVGGGQVVRRGRVSALPSCPHSRLARPRVYSRRHDKGKASPSTGRRRRLARGSAGRL